MSGDLKTLDSKFAIDKAAEQNKIVVYPESNQLQVDIDSDAAWDIFHTNLKVFLQKHTVAKIEMIPSASKGHWHITITLADVEFAEDKIPLRLLLQACLGSDLKRELLSYFRHEIGDEHPTLFIETQPAIVSLVPKYEEIPL